MTDSVDAQQSHSEIPDYSLAELWLALIADSLLLVTAVLLGFCAALVARFWQSRNDEHSRRYEELRDAIQQAAVISTDYWLKIDTLSDRQAEARLIGLFGLLNGLARNMAIATKDDHRVHTDRLLPFYKLTTGGENHEKSDRPVNPALAMAVQKEAADLVLYFDEYRNRRLTLIHGLRMPFRRPPKNETESSSKSGIN